MAIIQYQVKLLQTDAELKPFFLSRAGGDNLACSCCGKMLIAEEVAKLFAAIRKKVGKPITINSGYRCMKHQQRLLDQGYRAAQPKTAPHCYGVALDLDVPDGWTQERLAKLALELSGRQARVGWVDYAGQGFIHIDKAFLLKPNPAPNAFIAGVTW